MSRRSKPGWVAVEVRHNSKHVDGPPFDLTYCGHKHLTYSAAAACAQAWRRRTPVAIVIAGSR